MTGISVGVCRAEGFAYQMKFIIILSHVKRFAIDDSLQSLSLGWRAWGPLARCAAQCRVLRAFFQMTDLIRLYSRQGVRLSRKSVL